MAILLSSARQYAVEVAYDMADEKADRLANRWIRQALQRLWRLAEWRHYLAETRITMDPEETGSDLNVTQGSAAITRDTDWPAKYVSEAWDLKVNADSQKVYSLSAIGTPATGATLGTGQVWTGATATDLAYVASRYRYAMPGNFIRRALLVVELETWRPLSYLDPREFDYRRIVEPARRGERPLFFTLRGTASGLSIDLFPAAGDDYRSLHLTYVRKPTLPELADDGSDSVDWPEEYEDLFHRAIEVEAARVQGEAAQVPYKIALPEFLEAVKSARGLDAIKGYQPQAMGVTLPSARGSLAWSYYVRNTTVE